MYNPEIYLGRSATEELTEILRGRILNGLIEPGERLVESALAEEFSVSRGPVRGALTSLANSGLVVSLSRGGVHVIELTPRDAHEIYSVRVALEVLSIQQISMLPVVDLSAVNNALAVHVEATMAQASSASRREADLDLHRNFCLASKNSRLVASWDALRNQISLVIASVQRTQPESLRQIVQFHTEIVHAMNEGNWNAAEASLRRHLDESLTALVSLM